MTHEREATLVGQVKEPERRVNRTGYLVHFERTPGPCPYGQGWSRQLHHLPDRLPPSYATSVPFTAVRVGPERTTTETPSRLDLRRSPLGQVTIPADLALGAGGASPIALLDNEPRAGPPVVAGWRSDVVGMVLSL